MNMTEELQKLIETAVAEAAKNNGWEVPADFAVGLERPRQEGHGDLATNIAMQLAKRFGTNPHALAETIISRIAENNVIDKIEIAGPGFMNITLSSVWKEQAIKDAIELGADYGKSDIGKNRKVQIEFVSANPTGPLHMGHGRGAAVGDITANLLSYVGWDVEREYYVNDAGLQMELLGKSAQARYFEALSRSSEAPMPEDGYKGDYLVDIAKEFVGKYGSSLADKPLEETLPLFMRETSKYVLASIRKDLADFRVGFDTWFSEKTLYEDDSINKALEKLKAGDYAYEQDKAIWFRSTNFGDDKDRVLIRTNGIPTYFMSDVAYLKNKYDRGFEKLIYVWGADHHGYIPRIKSVNSALGHKDDDLNVLLIQMVNLLRDGKPVQMSKRAGTIVTLREIMEEVGTDATRFFFVMRRCDSTLDFDLNLAKKASSENPVFYIQYAHARICSIYQIAKDKGIAAPTLDELDASKFETPLENNLIKAIARMPKEIAKAAEELAPHKVAYYAQEIAEAFHAFYNGCRIIGEEESVMKSRLLLVEATRATLANLLGILGISAPEKM